MSTATEIMLKQQAAERVLAPIRERLRRLGRNVLWRIMYEQSIDMSAEAFKKEIHDLAARALERINTDLDTFVAKHFDHCPECRGEIYTSFHSAAECAFGDTYVTHCLDCDWQGEPE